VTSSDTQNPPRILVLMAAFSGAKWIGDQIQSVLNQKLVDLCLVIRDDASSDSTAADIEHIAARDAQVRLSVANAPSGSAARQQPCAGGQ
jgi:rhamnosyltransferase